MKNRENVEKRDLGMMPPVDTDMCSCDDCMNERERNSEEMTRSEVQAIEKDLLKQNHKLLEIGLVEEGKRKAYIEQNEFPNILITDHIIEEDEINQALDVIASYFMQNGLYRIVSDITKRNVLAGPTKKMTHSQVEEALGHRVELINE